MIIIYDLIGHWIFIAFIGAIITSFMSKPKDFGDGTGHFFAWIFLPIIAPILFLIGVFKWDFKLLKFMFKHIMNNSEDEDDEILGI